MHLRHAARVRFEPPAERNSACRAGRRRTVPHVTDYLSVFLGQGGWPPSAGVRRRGAHLVLPGADGRRTPGRYRYAPRAPRIKSACTRDDALGVLACRRGRRVSVSRHHPAPRSRTRETAPSGPDQPRRVLRARPAVRKRRWTRGGLGCKRPDRREKRRKRGGRAARDAPEDERAAALVTPRPHRATAARHAVGPVRPCTDRAGRVPLAVFA